MKKTMKLLTGFLSICISTPIWYFLLYSVLKAVNADRLMWFLFWMYLPVTFIGATISVIADKFLEE